MTEYVEVLLGLSDGRRLYAEFVAIEAAHELEIPTPAVRFFRHQRAPDGWPLRAWTDERRLSGEVRPGETAVWILADLPRDELAVTVAHECHHVRYHRRYGVGHYSPKEMASMEAAAEDFALRFTQRRTQKEQR
jgi:hypothetical protein